MIKNTLLENLSYTYNLSSFFIEIVNEFANEKIVAKDSFTNFITEGYSCEKDEIVLSCKESKENTFPFYIRLKIDFISLIYERWLERKILKLKDIKSIISHWESINLTDRITKLERKIQSLETSVNGYKNHIANALERIEESSKLLKELKSKQTLTIIN